MTSSHGPLRVGIGSPVAAGQSMLTTITPRIAAIGHLVRHGPVS